MAPLEDTLGRPIVVGGSLVRLVEAAGTVSIEVWEGPATGWVPSTAFAIGEVLGDSGHFASPDKLAKFGVTGTPPPNAPEKA